VEDVSQPPGHRQGVGLAADVLADDQELVAAETSEGVGRSEHSGQTLGHGHQQLVARAVAEGVVHQLEPLQINEEDPNWRRPTAGPGERQTEVVERARFGRPVRGSCRAAWRCCSSPANRRTAGKTRSKVANGSVAGGCRKATSRGTSGLFPGGLCR
jgi:hypothetical protein